jgi:hypothetical protein
MAQVIWIPEVLIFFGALSLKSQSSKVLDWWWVALLAIIVVGWVTSSEYMIMIGLVVVVIAAVLTYMLRHRWTIMSSQKV